MTNNISKNKKALLIMILIDVCLFSFLIIGSTVAPHFKGLAMIFSFAFGSIGYLVTLPFIIFLTARKTVISVDKKINIRLVVGYLLLVTSISVLQISNSYNGEESLTNISAFVDQLYISKNDTYGLLINPALGGGILSYLLCGFVTTLISNKATTIFGFILFGASLITLLYRLIKKFRIFLLKNYYKRLKKKKLMQQKEKEKEEELDLSSFTSNLLRQNLIKNIESSKDDDELMTRYERRMSDRLNNTVSKPIPTKTPDNEIGLEPAIFTETNDDVIEENNPVENSVSTALLSEEIFEINDPSSVKEEANTTLEQKSDDDSSLNNVGQNIVEDLQIDDHIPETVNESSVISSLQPKFKPLSDYELPGIDLLDPKHPADNLEEVEKACLENEQKINSKLESLGVGAYVSSHTIGPSVTRYEIKTHEDVPVSNVQRVINDLSIKLGGVPIRFETLVRGSEASGLEVINPVTSTVYFRDCYEKLPVGPKYKTVFPFGKTISGEVLCADLSEFPHMLVSGTSGSGKSIFLHQVLLPLVMRNRPEDLRLLLIDPKHIEMRKYKDIAHLICPVITDPIKARVALEKIVVEMERRYLVLDEAGGLSFSDFNVEYAEQNGLAKLPYIVVVIDEFADLVESNRNVSDLILKIAQKARAAGISIVLATQRPDVSIISGTIKANLQTRVALSMTSSTDSMTILGQGGAEDLNGKGDMLIDCQQIDRNGLIRCQGSWIEKNEIKRVTDHIKNNSKVQYYPEFLDLNDHSNDIDTSLPNVPSASELKDMNDDKRYSLVKEFVMTRDYASASGIQREFGIGYPKAGSYIDRLEKEGIIASFNDPRNTSRGRFIIVREQAPITQAGSLNETVVIPDGFPQPGDNE